MSDVANVAPKPDEIEITPEMIEAGTIELYSWDGESSAEDAVEEIFYAMISASKRKLTSRRR